ncbi:MAG: hypothetical protein B7X87_13770 [Hydrogenophilales bacterium 17-64-34]|nr:MAG: hypothetical protein B7X87_13770 [Hydrogenophilales bacterium 17-64-34]
MNCSPSVRDWAETASEALIDTAATMASAVREIFMVNGLSWSGLGDASQPDVQVGMWLTIDTCRRRCGQ